MMRGTSIDKMFDRIEKCPEIRYKTYEIGWYAYYDMAMMEKNNNELASRFADYKMYLHMENYKR